MPDTTNTTETGGADLLTIEAICAHCKNWFSRTEWIYPGEYAITDGVLSGVSDYLQNGQYYRIVGSVFNDGLHLYRDADGGNTDRENQSDDGATDATATVESGTGGALDGLVLVDETFTGAIWALAIPPAVVALAAEIQEWRGKYEDMLASPISSEAFGGYSYTKSGAAGTSTGGQTWQDIFASKLRRWRKL